MSYEEADDGVVYEDVDADVDVVEDELPKSDSDKSVSDDSDEEDADGTESDHPEGESEAIVEPSENNNHHPTGSSMKFVPKDQRITLPILTKYERAKLVGARAKLIDEGSTLLIAKPEGITNPIKLAQLELRAKKSPFLVYRMHADGSIEEWRVSEMQVE